jgi:flagellin|tara:strand:+ start:389 stop:688 length:300 start_codon:yes stop_codon:yes gene_type:complete
LATQSASGTIGQIERQTLQLEFSAPREEFDRISTTTEFNGKTQIEGSLAADIQESEQVTIQLGLDGSNESLINLNQELDLTASGSNGLGLANLSITTAE